jgi:hypothetical protein
MFHKTLFQWPPQPSTVIGLGILAGTVCYFSTGDLAWAGVAAAAVKIFVPDNSATAAGQVFEAVKILAEALGRPLPTTSQPAPVVSSDRGSGAAPPGRELPKE